MLLTKKNKFLSISALILVLGSTTVFFLRHLETNNILPAMMKTRYHKPPKRTPDTFKEDFGPTASKSELIFNGDSSFTFRYRKSKNKEHAFAGLFFPLENVDIDFSKYSSIEIGVQSHLARRVPLNLSVQNRIFTHQYVRHFIELKEGNHDYLLHLNDFFTPSSWYTANQISQSEIPEQDFSQIEALSLESCHLLARGIDDEFTITHLTLKRDFTLAYIFIGICCVGGIFLTRRSIYRSSNRTKSQSGARVTDLQEDSFNDQVILYIHEHFTSKELSIKTLENHFKQNENRLIHIIKDRTGNSFEGYVNYLRLEEAKKILQSNKHETISEVAHSVGFESLSNFNRVFKSQVGVSPKNFVELQGN